MSKLTQTERAAMLGSFHEADAKQLNDARFIAAICCDDEEYPEDAFLIITYYYALPENKDELNSTLSMMMLEV